MHNIGALWDGATGMCDQQFSKDRVLSLHQDPRRDLRYHVDLPARVVGDGPVVEAQLLNLSASGLQMRCGLDDIQHLLPGPGGEVPLARQPVPLQMQFKVALGEGILGRESVSLTCQVIYIRRQPQGRCLVGCQFKAFAGDSAQILERYLAQCEAGR